MQLIWLVFIIIFAIMICPSVFEKYGDYKQMTLLPWCDNPISTLPACAALRKYYPERRFQIDQPQGANVYETGNATNPNTISTWKLGNELNPVYR